MGSSAWYPSLGYHHNHHLANQHNHHTNNTHRRPNFLPVSTAAGPLSLRATVRRGVGVGEEMGMGLRKVTGLGKDQEDGDGELGCLGIVGWKERPF